MSLLDNLEAIDAIELHFVGKESTVLSIERNEYDMIKSPSDLKKYEESPFFTSQFEIEYERFNGTPIKRDK
ncbi:hypothetical protein [Peribacillus asahii]|uniref:hypothetical protein n=1 Tax=Peribacillus asahii TaxID=228899 RepID=UPI0037FB13F3